MLDPWVRDYQTHKWTNGEMIDRIDLNEMPREQEANLLVCLSGSPLAKKISGGELNRFYWDKELVVAGINPLYGGGLYRLTKKWNGYPAGRLVMIVCNENSPLTFIYAVEVG